MLNFFLMASAQSEEEDYGFFFIYAESIVKNIDGWLVSYQEAERIALTDPKRFSEILDFEITLGERNVVVTEIDDAYYQWIRVTRFSGYDAITSRSTSALGDTINGTHYPAVSYTHDALIMDKGDDITVIWTAVRTHG